MPKPSQLLAAAVALVLASCGEDHEAGRATAPREMALAESIERQVAAEHPEFDIRRYVRLYTRDDVGNVDGTYLIAGMGGLPAKWQGDRSYWIAPTEVPQVLDGGCGVISVRYNIASNELVSISCNGDA